MKKGLAALAVAVTTGSLVYLVLAPRLIGHGSNGSPGRLGGPGTQSASQPDIAAPTTPEQQAYAALETKRRPYYSRLKSDVGDLIANAVPAQDDQATLVLYAQTDSATVIQDMLARAVAADAYGYGFRHVRFYVPNPPGSIDQYRLAAEADADDAGRWNTFLK